FVCICCTSVSICVQKKPALRAGINPRASKNQRLKAGGTRTHRNPPHSCLSSGGTSNRSAERRCSGEASNDPPRSTREDPEEGPAGLTSTPEPYAPYQSQHHSQTLPCMSYSPQRLGCFCPTACTCLEAFPANQA